MRKMLLMLAAAVVLSGCASMLQNAYDERRQEECEEDNHGSDRALNC